MTIRDMVLELIKTQEEYFAASIAARHLHQKWIDASNTLAEEMSRDDSECVIVDGRVVIFHGYDFDNEKESMVTTAFSIYTPSHVVETAK